MCVLLLWLFLAFLLLFQCSVGSTVKLQVGGDFYYYAEKSEQKLDLLLIAGGVGINPLISTMRHAEDLNEGSCGQSEHFGRLMLLYSARSKEELIFYVSIIPCADPECFVRGGLTLITFWGRMLASGLKFNTYSFSVTSIFHPCQAIH